MADFLIKAIIFIVCVDLMLFLGQTAINNVAPTIGRTPIQFFSVSNSSLSIGGSCTSSSCVLDTTTITDKIINPTTQTSSGTGDFFSDTVKDIKDWFISKIPGINLLLTIVAAPASMLNIIGAPTEVVWAIGALWMFFTIIVIVAFITGRGN